MVASTFPPTLSPGLGDRGCGDDEEVCPVLWGEPPRVYSDPTIRLQGAPASAGVQGQQRRRADRQATSEVKTLTKALIGPGGVSG